MSVPLDRLYYFLNDQINDNDDILIYRWWPHGSKNLKDLRPLDDKVAPSWTTNMTHLPLIMHDQEPVDYFYAESQPKIDTIIPGIDSLGLMVQQHPTFREFWKPMSTLRYWISKTNIHDKYLLCHSEKNSLDLEKYSSEFIGVYYWSHAIIARDWFRYAVHDKVLNYNPTQYKFDFLVYNRAWSGSREYRLKFSELLHESKLTPNCLTSFSATDNGVHYTLHKFSNPVFEVKTPDLDQQFEPNTFGPSASADYNNNDYAQCGLEVVLETLFDTTKNHLTEKTLRPIACKKPFILVSSAGSLKYLRDYGFKTFSPWINESYDEIADPGQRLSAIMCEMDRIRSLPQAQKLELWSELNKIAEYNQRLFFSDQWQQSIVDEFVDNLNQAINEAKQYKKGTWYFNSKKLINSIPEIQEYTNTTISNLRSDDELNYVLSKIDR